MEQFSHLTPPPVTALDIGNMLCNYLGRALFQLVAHFTNCITAGGHDVLTAGGHNVLMRRICSATESLASNKFDWAALPG